MRRRPTGVFLRRVGATALDDAAAGLALGAVWGVNALASRRGWASPLALRGRVRLWVPICVTLPAAVALAIMEHRGGSPGKRALGLRVRSWPADPGPVDVSLGRAVLRSLLKTGLAWELGHQSVWQFRAGKDVSGGVLAAAAQLLLLGQAYGVARGSGRTFPDRLVGTVVIVDRAT